METVFPTPTSGRQEFRPNTDHEPTARRRAPHRRPSSGGGRTLRPETARVRIPAPLPVHGEISSRPLAPPRISFLIRSGDDGVDGDADEQSGRLPRARACAGRRERHRAKTPSIRLLVPLPGARAGPGERGLSLPGEAVWPRAKDLVKAHNPSTLSYSGWA